MMRLAELPTRRGREPKAGKRKSIAYRRGIDGVEESRSHARRSDGGVPSARDLLRRLVLFLGSARAKTR